MSDSEALMKRRCPNCNSPRFIDVPALEFCPDCKLECDYRGTGANGVYKNYVAEKHAADEREEEARIKALMDVRYGEGNW